MRKIYHLSTCSTCQRILKSVLAEAGDFDLQDIKTEAMTEAQVDEMAQLAGSYEALFSRRAMKYKSMGLADKDLQESDYRSLILEEYTFLKRPVILIDGAIFVGNAKSTTEAALAALRR